MVAIKNWFLEKNNYQYLREKELGIEKETEKAVQIYYTSGNLKVLFWIPKSVVIDEWEELPKVKIKKDISNFGYHDYLVDVFRKAYRNNELYEQHTIRGGGYNVYSGDAFIHQWKTKELIATLDKYNVKYMNRTEWNNR